MREEVIGRNPRLLQAGTAPAGAFAAMWATLAAGKDWRGEMVNRRKDGTDYTGAMTITPVFDAAGALSAFDAGVGIANFGHIIELRPDFVKFDISLVRRVNVDLGRQALVVAMRHFARTAGCRIVAEGIETDEEARALRQLGVEFGQGFWFGRPAPVEHRAGGEVGPATGGALD